MAEPGVKVVALFGCSMRYTPRVAPKLFQSSLMPASVCLLRLGANTSLGLVTPVLGAVGPWARPSMRLA
ncbi:hypothetical protein D3C75_1343840 [compost metagenome]